MFKPALCLGLVLACGALLCAQAPTPAFDEYTPRSTLKVPQHIIPRAKYPFIDVHNHQNGASRSPEQIEELIRGMDSINLKIMVNLSGGSGERLAQQVRAFKAKYPNRFVVFANIDFSKVDEPEFGQHAAAQLEQDVKNGAQGLKIFKNFGMDTKYRDGHRMPVDDPAMDPVWEMCAHLKIPVLIHTAEPAPFFQPLDKYNERLLELKTHPGRVRPPERYPSWETIMAERDRMFAKHPNTTYIVAHFGWMANDLDALGKLLDRLPNTVVEVAAILAELGRQPLAAHEFFVKYQDRIMFGKDTWYPEEYKTYFRCFETRDEYFDYYRNYHAFWKIYGFQLPDEVLKKVYYKNALRVIPGLDASLFPK